MGAALSILSFSTHTLSLSVGNRLIQTEILTQRAFELKSVTVFNPLTRSECKRVNKLQDGEEPW